VPGREPSPRELGALIQRARGEGLPSLFTEPQFPEAAARVVAEDAGLRVQLVDPIGGVPGRSTYIEMMRFNAAAFRKGLS
jgi:ABC-type Zn uptake system ZnuABC Zn-binding protein ZnuA